MYRELRRSTAVLGISLLIWIHPASAPYAVEKTTGDLPTLVTQYRSSSRIMLIT